MEGAHPFGGQVGMFLCPSEIDGIDLDGVATIGAAMGTTTSMVMDIMMRGTTILGITTVTGVHQIMAIVVM